MTLAKELVKDIIVVGRALILQSIGVFTSSPPVFGVLHVPRLGKP